MKFSEAVHDRMRDILMADRASSMHGAIVAILDSLTVEDIALALVGSENGSAITVGYAAIRDAAFEEAARKCWDLDDREPASEYQEACLDCADAIRAPKSKP